MLLSGCFGLDVSVADLQQLYNALSPLAYTAPGSPTFSNSVIYQVSETLGWHTFQTTLLPCSLGSKSLKGAPLLIKQQECAVAMAQSPSICLARGEGGLHALTLRF